MTTRTGYLDLCSQSHCAGWASDGDVAATLELFINGVPASDLVCDVDRPDLLVHGFPRMSGFSHVFATPLAAEDVVDVRFKDGPSIGKSPSTAHRARLERLLTGVSKTRRGLELGPLDRPILGKPTYDVAYVDHASREDLVQKYKQTGSAATLRPDEIRDVDYVWNGTRLRGITGGGFAYCLASHVIEHVADPIGWLIEIAEVLEPGGRLNLAIPERSRTFDQRRAPSTVAAMLDAHSRRLTRPSFGQIFDHISGVCPIGGPEPDPVAAARDAFAVATAVEADGKYLDVHCHVWSHETFGQCWQTIACLGLVPLRLDLLSPPAGDWNEFIVSFVRD